MFGLENQNHIESFGDCENLTGKLLIASPIMDDEYFKNSIVYVCAHDENSAIGVMVNRVISEINLESLLELSHYPKDKMAPLYSGGPVSVDKTIILTIRKNYYRSFDQNPVVTIFTDLNDFRNAFKKGMISKKFLIAQGITAWDSLQLSSEVSQNFWIVANTTRDAIFSNKKNIWETEIKKLGLKPNSKHIVSYTGQA